MTYPMVALSSIARPISRPVEVISGISYRTIGVKWWGEGAYERETIDGSQTAAKTLSLVREGDLIINKIWVRHGSTAIASKAVDGCAASGEFPTFELDHSQVLPRWIHWQTKTRTFWSKCDALSRGTSGKNRIRPELFLTIQVPLPSLDEQRRIVARIEEIAADIAEARGLRREAVEEADLAWRSALARAFEDSIESHQRSGTAKDLLLEQADVYAQQPRNQYNNASPWNPRIYDNGVYPLPQTWVWTDLGSILTHLVDCINDTPEFSLEPTGLIGLKTNNVRPYKMDLSQKWFMSPEDFQWWNRREQPQPGDIILTREAPMGYACILPKGPPMCLTQRLMLLRTDNRFIDCKYVLHYINSSHFIDQVLTHCRGLTTPHIRVRDVPCIRVPLPPRRQQVMIVEQLDSLQRQIESLKLLQAETQAELDALLPAVLDKTFKGEL